MPLSKIPVIIGIICLGFASSAFAGEPQRGIANESISLSIGLKIGTAFLEQSTNDGVFRHCSLQVTGWVYDGPQAVNITA